MMNANEVMRIGRRRTRAPLSAASITDAPLELGFGELDDQDRIFGGETDQHDETDLGINIVVEIARPQAKERATNGDRDAEQHAEGQRPAFIESGQDQKYQH